MAVDGERPPDIAPAHELEADMVNEAHRTSPSGHDGSECDGVQLGIHPFDRQQREEVVAQRAHGVEADPALRECHRLDQHVAVCDQARVVIEQPIERPCDRGVRAVIAVEQREDRRCIDEDGYAPNASSR